ncbi:MAG TPA: BCAM0308 family protein [Blastocatellia bacterium]|nr:BCAM0308 family protein [Blastocatellia bacterium]
MRTSKRYSNVTFTKRVDHEAGRHRTTRAPAEPAICNLCGAVYFKRRWRLAGEPGKSGKRKDWHPTQIRICPACKKRQEGLPAGFVYLDGAFLSAHRAEIIRLLNNEADRAAADNPIGRIMAWQADRSEGIVITTTTEHLAKRLGQALEKAFGGEVRYDFSHENKLARVYWHRD